MCESSSEDNSTFHLGCSENISNILFQLPDICDIYFFSLFNERAECSRNRNFQLGSCVVISKHLENSQNLISFGKIKGNKRREGIKLFWC